MKRSHLDLLISTIAWYNQQTLNFVFNVIKTFVIWCDLLNCSLQKLNFKQFG